MKTLCILLLALVACGGGAPDAAAPSQTPAPTTAAPAAAPADAAPAAGHASADVVPGSHEDWCGEHAVPESQCTRCNASLIPAFQATGDWCAEHGLPESQCLECNPDLKIERPAKAG